MLTIKDRFSNFYIYIHRNGAPEQVIANIQKAIEFAWELPRFEAWEFATAIIKVLKEWPWKVYLCRHFDRVMNVDYHYEISAYIWDIQVKTHCLKSNTESSTILY